jgi:hypothetical protein
MEFLPQLPADQFKQHVIVESCPSARCNTAFDGGTHLRRNGSGAAMPGTAGDGGDDGAAPPS